MSDFRQPGDHLDITFGASVAPGTLVQHGGAVGIVDPKPDGTNWEAGEVGSVRIRCVVRVDNPDSVAFSDGATVAYIAATDKVAAALGGDFDAGTAIGAWVGTEGYVDVLLDPGHP